MNKLVIIFILALSANLLHGQRYYSPPISKSLKVELNTIASRSIHGRKMGLALNLNINNRWHVNCFSLKSYNSGESVSATHRGGQVRYFLNPNKRLSVGPALKVGYYNRYFLNILPSVHARYKLIDNINIGGGVAYSDGFPYFDLELGIVLFER